MRPFVSSLWLTRCRVRAKRAVQCEAGFGKVQARSQNVSPGLEQPRVIPLLIKKLYMTMCGLSTVCVVCHALDAAQLISKRWHGTSELEDDLQHNY